MNDLGGAVLGDLGFALPFYFRYVDDTLLCIPKDKLVEVFKKFNSYHPRLQFTFETEKNNKLQFSDIELKEKLTVKSLRTGTEKELIQAGF